MAEVNPNFVREQEWSENIHETKGLLIKRQETIHQYFNALAFCPLFFNIFPPDSVEIEQCPSFTDTYLIRV